MSSSRIGEIGGLPPSSVAPQARTVGDSPGAPTFGEALESALRAVDSEMQAADRGAAAYVGGANVDLHNVLLDIERADLSFRTMVQLRNKLLEAYQEMMRISV